ncbi:CidA/LrgA family protein [Geofilum sp. OHC36d9]|uniref:CidA/LrgA family protein n=1 Tax=Geofilum sp. OHC36d9 TaxID=3458413 RepID=UPI004034AA19
MYGIFIIFLLYALGNVISWLTGGYIPGSVIGMLLLFTGLLTGIIKPAKIAPAANFLVGNMALFFVPVGVGLMVSIHFFNGNLMAIVASVIISTFLVLLSTGFVQQWMEKWKK